MQWENKDMASCRVALGIRVERFFSGVFLYLLMVDVHSASFDYFFL